MNVGFVGLGKLGLPCATCVAMKGHKVMGHDLDQWRMSHEPQPYREAGPDGTGDFNTFLGSDRTRENLSFGTMEQVANFGDIIFLAVQTPHDARYEGVTRIPDERVDFDYSWLVEAVTALAGPLAARREQVVLAVISTCLPGTMRRLILPLLPSNVHLAYNPFFIAMGTTMRDFLDPEFVLLGGECDWAMDRVEDFYLTISPAPVARMSIESAELTKVSYNTMISLKIAFANTIMEICEHIPEADCDEVVDALSLAHRRLISPAYLRGGMGDGGGCHPRDNIAMSWLARKHHLSCDIFDMTMRCREEQTNYLAAQARLLAHAYRLPVVILGEAFKPESDLVVGSPARLLEKMMRESWTNTPCTPSVEPMVIDAHVRPDDADWKPVAAVYVIGCKHPEYQDFQFPVGSVVIDPHRYIANHEGVTVFHLGARKEA